MPKKKYIKSPIILAILCAVGVHTVLFTDAGHRLQGAITESTEISTSDSQLVLKDNTISLVVQKDITKATRAVAVLMYNHESLSLSKPQSNFGKIIEQSEEYSNSITLTFSSPQDITQGTILATWEISEALPEIHTINLTDVQIESSDGIISLSTRGTGTF